MNGEISPFVDEQKKKKTFIKQFILFAFFKGCSNSVLNKSVEIGM